MPQNTHRLAWARINADTVFLALLAIGTGIFGILYPYTDEVAIYLNDATPTHYLRYGGFVVGGVVILVGLIFENFAIEFVARSIVMAAVVVDIWRTALTLGFESPDEMSAISLLLILMISTGLRASVFFQKHGLIIEIPSSRTEKE